MQSYDDRKYSAIPARFVRRTLVCGGLAALMWVAVGCATTGDAQAGDRTRSARCVISDMGDSDVVIEDCIVEMGPAGTPRHIRLPMYETRTKSPYGRLQYPLTFEVASEDEDGLVIELSGASLEPAEGEAPPETPDFDEEEEESGEGSGEQPDGDESSETNDSPEADEPQ